MQGLHTARGRGAQFAAFGTAMRMLRLLALATVLAAACRLDKLLQSAGPPPPPTAYGAAGLAFTAQPESARAGQRIAPVQVTVRDSADAPATKFTGPVTVTLDHSPGGASLNGRRTVPAANGGGAVPPP